jgi:hypothetical protein
MPYRSIFYNLLTDVQTEIQALITADKLPNIASNAVLVMLVPTLRQLGVSKTPSIPFPAIVIAPAAGLQEDPNEGTNARDDIMFPVSIEVVMANNQQPNPTNDDLFCLWTEELHSYWRHRYTNPQGPPNTQFFKSDVINPVFGGNVPEGLEAWLAGYQISQLVVKFVTRLPRGG